MNAEYLCIQKIAGKREGLWRVEFFGTRTTVSAMGKVSLHGRIHFPAKGVARATTQKM